MSCHIQNLAGERMVDTHLVLYIGGEAFGFCIYRLKRSTRMRVLIQRYCSEMPWNTRDIYFLYRGRRIKNNDTPLSLAMDYGDIVKVCKKKRGFSRRKSV